MYEPYNEFSLQLRIKKPSNFSSETRSAVLERVDDMAIGVSRRQSPPREEGWLRQ